MLAALCLTPACLADSSTSQEVKNKLNTKTINTITVSPPKPEIYFQSMSHQHHQNPYVQLQMFPKQFVPQPQPQPAMIIIAQPAVVPQQLIYNAAIQQLLSYFHNNPQARYQFLYGYQPQPHPTAQPYIAQPSHQYQVVPGPQFQQLIAATPPTTFNQVNHQQQYAHPFPYNFNQISQQAAGAGVAGHVRSIPPIITGLENFTPEQQAQIKSQLGVHLGGLTTTSSSQEQLQGSTTKYVLPAPSTTSLNTNEFVPSPQDTNTNYNSNNNHSDMFKTTTFTKG